MAEETVLLEAEFNPRVCTYWLLSGALVMTLCIVTIPLLPFWFFFGGMLTRRYLSRMRCRLTPRALKLDRGYFVRTEKTVPLDKITDLGLVQGPIMRHFELEALSIETAGQSGPGALVRVTGIVDGRAFRDRVLARRDEVVAAASDAPAPAPAAATAPSQGLASSDETTALLREIRDGIVALARRSEGPGAD